MCAPVEAGSGRKCVQRDCAVAGLSHRCERPSRELRDLEARGAREVERGEVVVREQLGVILRPSQGLDPPRDAKVLLGASCSRDCRIGGIPDERVGEDLLALVGDGSLARPASRTLPLERLQVLFDASSDLAACSRNGSDQKTPPATDAPWATRFSASGNESSRATISAWTVSGTL